ncbi:hypothetical protein BDW_08780 [Bdellovibrio bacteriovorus W]|nr:hypothetical protein BDW_08780 [Bdellovibrio bacteriovorus W]
MPLERQGVAQFTAQIPRITTVLLSYFLELVFLAGAGTSLIGVLASLLCFSRT